MGKNKSLYFVLSVVLGLLITGLYTKPVYAS